MENKVNSTEKLYLVMSIVMFLCFFLIVMLVSNSVKAQQIFPAHTADVSLEKALAPDHDAQEKLRDSESWQDFISKHGTWYAVFDELTGKPHRAFGQPLVHHYRGTVEEIARQLLRNELAAWVTVDEENLVYVYRPQAGNKYRYVHFTQRHRGLDVLNSHIIMKFTQDNRLIMFGMDIYDDIQADVNPAIPVDAALSASGHTRNASGTLKILPVVNKPDGSYDYKLVYEVAAGALAGKQAHAYRGLVDAGSGEVLYEDKLEDYCPYHSASITSADAHVMHDVIDVVDEAGHSIAPATADVTVTGTLYASNPVDDPGGSVLPVPFSRVTVNNTEYYTDMNGNVSIPVSGPVSATFKLAGPWTYGKTYSQPVPEFTVTINPGANNISYDTHATMPELTAFYHTNLVHEYVKSKMPGYTGMDYQCGNNVDDPGMPCNAQFNGSYLAYGATGSSNCTSIANVRDVVYHEYAHGITPDFGQPNWAFGEAYSDVWAMGITENPEYCRGYLINSTTYTVRRYDINKKVYPMDLRNEEHLDGEIIAGAWWDVAEELGDPQQMIGIFTETLNSLSAIGGNFFGGMMADVLLDALQADDDDGDVTNGTPNDKAIVKGFALHGISLLSNASISHTELTSTTANNPVQVTADISWTYAWSMQEPRVYFRLNTNPQWFSVPMTNTGGSTYAGQIPAQPEGTLIAYYIGLTDINGSVTKTAPNGTNITAAYSDIPNIPYYALNGFTLQRVEDFDNYWGNWTAGLPSDNATAGIWEIEVPIGSSDYGMPVQAGSNHTPGGIACAFTGNAGSTGDAVGTNDVDGGATTLVSPVFDLTGMTNPLFSYYRWYANSCTSCGNKRNDFWTVEITNDGVNWAPVEQTNMDDHSWRQFAFRVKDYITPSSTVQLRFIAADSINNKYANEGQSIVEAAVDDLELWDATGFPTTAGFTETAVTVAIYPNPARERLTVDGLAPGYNRIVLTDATGRVCAENTVENTTQATLSLDNLSSGLYLVTVYGDQSVISRKVTIE